MTPKGGVDTLSTVKGGLVVTKEEAREALLERMQSPLLSAAKFDELKRRVELLEEKEE
jgi:hypothetical protein